MEKACALYMKGGEGVSTEELPILLKRFVKSPPEMSVTAVWRRSFCLTGKFGPVIFFPFLNVF
jgi:hypothetical protein